MPIVKYFVTIIVVLMLLQDAVFGQQHKYQIKLAGGNIGTIEATLSHEKGISSYEIESEVATRLALKKIKRTTTHSIEIKDGSLIASDVVVYANERKEDSVSLRLNLDGSYRSYSYVKKKRTIENWGAICFTTSMLYFQEPLLLKEVFSELQLGYGTLEKIAPHTYTLCLPDGKENIYTYRNGELQSVKVNRSWVNLEFEKI